MDRFAATPQPPYYVVTFSSQSSGVDAEGYGPMAERMVELALQQPGCLGIESSRDSHGFGITLSFWESEAAIRAWKGHLEHGRAQRKGRDVWYAAYALRVARVERAYGFRSGDDG